MDDGVLSMNLHPAVHRYLDCSTCHISEASAEWLTERSPERKLPVCMARPEGWLLWVPGDDNPADQLLDIEPNNEPWPDDIRHLLLYANSMGCSYVLLDCDGHELDQLPSYDW